MFSDSEKIKLQNALQTQMNDKNLSLVNETMSYQQLNEYKLQYDDATGKLSIIN